MTNVKFFLGSSDFLLKINKLNDLNVKLMSPKFLIKFVKYFFILDVILGLKLLLPRGMYVEEIEEKKKEIVSLVNRIILKMAFKIDYNNYSDSANQIFENQVLVKKISDEIRYLDPKKKYFKFSKSL